MAIALRSCDAVRRYPLGVEEGEKMENVFVFKETYGHFTSLMRYSQLDLAMSLIHRKTLWVRLDDREVIQIGILAGRTPKTYHSGNRVYGKYIFIVPNDIKVVRYEFLADSNASAKNGNQCLLRGGEHRGRSFGFDFYRIRPLVDGAPSMEHAEKVRSIGYHGWGDLPDEVFIQNLMPANLAEAIKGFPHQTSGWRRNDGETHLHAVTEINGTGCWVPFAATKIEIDAIEGVETNFMRTLIEGPAQD